LIPRRRLGRSGIEVGAIALGCWAIGGPFSAAALPLPTPEQMREVEVMIRT
jgi:aryl-alcohol dehydrogenase-like predicted oxidoreductase